jgi:hypothetical protein
MISAINIIKKERRETEIGNHEILRTPLPLFMLTFDNTENIKNIYEIKSIQNMLVKIEPVKRSTLVPQCKRCQLYGHTQKFCARVPRCVKCAGKHLTSTCKKPRDEKPKCANCLKEHPASYRGCEVAKEFQARRDKANKRSNEAATENRECPKATIKQTFAQAVTGNNQIEVNQNQNDITNHLLLKMMLKMEQQEKLFETFNSRLSALENNIKNAIPSKTRK